MLANVGAAGLAATASTSFRRSAIPASNAGRKCSVRIFSNGAIPNGVVHSVKNGFVSAFGSAAGWARQGIAIATAATATRRFFM